MLLPENLRKSLTLVQAPVNDITDATKCVLSLAQAKAYARIDWDDEDATTIPIALNAVTERLDGAGGILGRALLSQQWLMRLDGFGRTEAPHYFVPGNLLATGVVGATTGRIKIPLPPLVTIDSVQYVDVDGNLQTVDPSIYQLVVGGQQGYSYIQPAFQQSWPAHRLEPDAVRITFTAGYGTGANLPNGIRLGAGMLFKHLFDNRDSVVIGAGAALIVPNTVESILSPFVASWF